MTGTVDPEVGQIWLAYSKSPGRGKCRVEVLRIDPHGYYVWDIDSPEGVQRGFHLDRSEFRGRVKEGTDGLSET